MSTESKRFSGLLTRLGRKALRAKIGSGEAESEDLGGSKIEGNNEGWPNFRRSPQGRGEFSRFRRRSSLQ
jgi:hypothetical protein